MCVIGGWCGRVNKIIHIKDAVWLNESFPDSNVMFSISLPCKLLLPSILAMEEGDNIWLTDTASTMPDSLDRDYLC